MQDILRAALMLEVLELMKSKNVRIQTGLQSQGGTVSYAQARARMQQYGQKLGLNLIPWQAASSERSSLGPPLHKPPGYVDKVGRNSKGFPTVSGNNVSFGGAFPADHELAHAIMTGPGETIEQHNDRIIDTPEGDSEERGTALTENAIRRRAGLRPLNDTRNWRPTGGSNDPGPGNEKEVAQKVISKLDNGDKFSTTGHFQPSTGIDSKINKRASLIPGRR